MARLAIRATGDRSKRENITVGDNNVVVYISEFNAPQLCVEAYHDSETATTHYVVSVHHFGKWYKKYDTATLWNNSETHRAL